MKELRDLGVELTDRECRLISALMVIGSLPEASTQTEKGEVFRLYDHGLRCAKNALEFEVKKAKEQLSGKPAA